MMFVDMQKLSTP